MTETNSDINTNITDDQILYIHTRKIPAIKSLIEALKEIFRDVNIKFTPKIEKTVDGDPTKTKITGGMYITALNSNSNILVRLHLEADKFCYYHCKPENDKQYIMLGINMSNLFKLIKFLNNDDELFMVYDRRSLNQLNLQYVNKQKKFTSNYYLNLLDLKEDIFNIGKQQFDFVITMPSSDFHSLIKNMGVIAEQVDIKFITTKNNYSLSFSCRGEFASQESVFNGVANSQNENNMINVLKNNENKDENKNKDESEHKSKEDEHTIIQGIYELKALSLFSRCSSLCSTIELYIKNDSPLVIKYRIADMGSVHLILSPINNNDGIENDSDNESEQE
jgi:proliferating cell nuclear antigen